VIKVGLWSRFDRIAALIKALRRRITAAPPHS
jgi:hypothetical protein